MCSVKLLSSRCGATGSRALFRRLKSRVVRLSIFACALAVRNEGPPIPLRRQNVRFCILAIAAKTNQPGLMGYANNSEDAEAIRSSAIRAGFLIATIAESWEEFQEFG